VIEPTATGRLSFARGLIAFGWVGIGLLGPIAFFLTWFGDCFAEVCPSATTADRFVYGFDAVAWISVGIIGLLVAARPHRVPFATLALLGVAFAAQGIAGFLGARGFYAFGLITPAALLLTVGGVLGMRTSSALSLLADQSASDAFGLGCTTYVVAYLAFIGIAFAVGGEPIGLLVTVLVVAVVPLWITVSRRRRAKEEGLTEERNGRGGGI
jgi:hypothetical protein